MKNFMSVGNTAQTINLDKEALVLILGENLDLGGEDSNSRNGCGKTTLLNAISYALFSWPISDIKKEHLINNVNGKNMQVIIDFEVNNKQYKIVRGLKPRVLEFYENGYVKGNTDILEVKDSAQGENKETQVEIEKVIGMTHDMFCQIVAINTYTQPFLFQAVAEQRKIIEQLLGITLLSKKAEKLKEDIKNTRLLLTKEEATIKANETANKQIQNQIDRLITTQSEWLRKKENDISKLEEQIKNLSGINIEEELSNHIIHEKATQLSNEIHNKTKSKNHLDSLLKKENAILSSLMKDLKILENQSCQTCGQKLDTKTHIQLLSVLKENIFNSEKEASKLSQSIEELFLDIQNLENLFLSTCPVLPKLFYNTINDAHKHKNLLNLAQQQLENRQNDNDPYQDQITMLKNNVLIQIDISVMNELSKFAEHQEFLLKLLTNKDSFIRKKIIEQNLNYLNARLSYYLNELGLPHDVVFQNDLSINISELGREISPGGLSRGEMTRLSLGLSFSFRDIYESIFQKINILACDESLDSGMDGNGTENAMKLLRDMSRELNRSVWVISHKTEFENKADYVIKAIKENRFTTFEICQ